jgi:hypothetical protein
MPDPQIATRPRDDPTYDVDPGRGWVLFAGIALALAGVLNIIYGIGAIGDSQFYVRDAEYVLGNLHTWGWLMLVAGVVQAVAAIGIWAATEWGRWLGILSALGNMLIQFLVLPARPALAVTLFLIDVIVVYGLLTFGGRHRHDLGG